VYGILLVSWSYFSVADLEKKGEKEKHIESYERVSVFGFLAISRMILWISFLSPYVLYISNLVNTFTPSYHGIASVFIICFGIFT
jgi:hypothetical protein